MVIYPEQIPDGYTFDDYPSGTKFVLIDDTPLKCDPETFRIIWLPKKPLIYPEDLK